MKRIKFKENNSKSEIKRIIINLARYSYPTIGFFGSDEEILEKIDKIYKENGTSLNNVIENCKNHWSSVIPILENFNRKRYYVKDGEKITIEKLFFPEENTEMDGPGFILDDEYISRYAFYIDCLREAVKFSNYFYFLAAVTFGISSIDAYINFEARKWNNLMPNDLLEDTKENRTCLNQKIKFWIPKLSNGKSLQIGSLSFWNKFDKLKKIRDDVAIHPKTTILEIPLEDFKDQVNMFREGISKLLFELHKMCDISGAFVPSLIIRHCYSPDAYIE